MARSTTVWQLQTAKQKFSEVVSRALDEGPQVITRHGREVVVVLSVDEYRRLPRRKDFKQFLVDGPRFDELELERPQDRPRRVEL
jgi:prevent-host-death family protein